MARDFAAKVALMAMAFAAWAAAAEVGHSQQQQPNVLWLIAEDMGPDALGLWGRPEAHTPNIDRLAADGVLYTRAYATGPVCSASRSAFMTGMYQTTIGAHNHRSHRDDDYRLPAGVRPLPERLTEAGYFTANVVRFPPEVGFNGRGKVDWNFAHQTPEFEGRRWAELRRRQPFYSQVNFEETHRPHQAPPRARPERVEIAPYYPDHPTTRADQAAYLDAATELDRKVGAVLAQLERDELADSTVVVFFADNGACHVRGKQFCYEEGLHVPLIIRWPKGFAPPSGWQPGSKDDRLVELIDLAPTTFALAGVARPAGMQGRVLLGANADPPREFAFGARDRCDETVMRIRSVRDERYRYVRNFTPETPLMAPNEYKQGSYPVWSLLKQLDAEGKLTAVQSVLCRPRLPEEELYDLGDDPWEVNNLVGSANAEDRQALARLRAALDGWLRDTADKGAEFEPPEVAAAQGATAKINERARPETAQ